ncbi:MAG: hypothetical protein IKZ07_05690 [Akkermansia sp.]|nr:hypothetical protein [Akkermansia sp.]
MKTIFHKILATTALCLAVAGLSSCISRLHREAYEFPRSYEGVWLENNSVSQDGSAANMKLTKRLYVYECDGQWYLPVSRIQYKKSVRWYQWKPYEMGDISYEDKQQYYLPISAEFAGILRTPSRLCWEPPAFGSHKSDLVQSTELLKALPPQAKPYPILCPVSGFDEPGVCLAQTDTHVGPSAILAYPAAALLFVVDVPVTVVSTAVGYTIAGIFMPLYIPLKYSAEKSPKGITSCPLSPESLPPQPCALRRRDK